MKRIVGEKVEKGKKMYKVKWMNKGTTREPEENFGWRAGDGE